MRLEFLEQSPREQRLYIDQCALVRQIHPAIVEKDFWVCWLLGILFGDSMEEWENKLLFKGGTSLSKVFRVLERFSEDIDLGISPESLSVSEAEVDRAATRNQREKWMVQLQRKCASAVRDDLMPKLERAIETILGRPDRTTTWVRFDSDEDPRNVVLLFDYPSLVRDGFDYLRRSVKLEFGSLTDQRPTARHPIEPWLMETYRDAFSDWRCEVVALEVERTFWEKATILHAEYHRPRAQHVRDRIARHYSDFSQLWNHPARAIALSRLDLLARVATHKKHFFDSAWANYESATPGTLRLVPPDFRVEAIRADHEKMSQMYLREPPSFDSILSALQQAERDINRRN